MNTTRFMSLRELRNETGKIKEILANNGKIIITNKGKPEALMLDVDEQNFEETLSLINQIRLSRAISNIRETANKNGTADMTMDEINEMITESRKERREKSAKQGKQNV